ncbi:PilN domain-containing protein [Methylobacter psychrophilus]|jgi:general secretion pathway protein L|uniref:PilN domain-containing protein n=1 Tax=Methylobacter psychrophilus TaxID=96941 RepID=UPI0021D4CCA8|nr:PilN domain-containing protein [Methylobacter psychrophilus]
MLNLNSTIDLNFKQLFSWWKRELGFLVPEKIKLFLNDQQGFIIVSPDGRDLKLTYINNGQIKALELPERGARDLTFQRLCEKDERLAKAKVIIRLTDQHAIQKELGLPVAAKENLDQVIAYELDRYTPFKAEQVYFAVKPLPGVNEPGQLKVLLILTTREALDGLYKDVKALGLSPLLADYQDSANNLDKLDLAYNLLPARLGQKTAQLPQLIHWGLTTLTYLLLMAVIVVPVWFEYQTVNALQVKADSLEKEAKKVKALQSEIEAVIDETRQLIKEKNATPEVIAILNTLSSLIKDDTWLSYAQYSDGHLQIQGESPEASTLIAVLEASELFVNARFASPVTQDRISKLERFQITVDVANAGVVTSE